MPEPEKIAILGPTASGKSVLAVAVARRIGGTVVNGDPFQAYRDLPVGTGQPRPEETGSVPHQGYGLLPLGARLNPAGFGELAAQLGARLDIFTELVCAAVYLHRALAAAAPDGIHQRAGPVGLDLRSHLLYPG